MEKQNRNQNQAGSSKGKGQQGDMQGNVQNLQLRSDNLQGREIIPKDPSFQELFKGSHSKWISGNARIAVFIEFENPVQWSISINYLSNDYKKYTIGV